MVRKWRATVALWPTISSAGPSSPRVPAGRRSALARRLRPRPLPVRAIVQPAFTGRRGSGEESRLHFGKDLVADLIHVGAAFAR
jgi:hypothetical protein